jgi:thiosulfate reductase cytochrome b subunit
VPNQEPPRRRQGLPRSGGLTKPILSSSTFSAATPAATTPIEPVEATAALTTAIPKAPLTASKGRRGLPRPTVSPSPTDEHANQLPPPAGDGRRGLRATSTDSSATAAPTAPAAPAAAKTTALRAALPSRPTGTNGPAGKRPSSTGRSHRKFTLGSGTRRYVVGAVGLVIAAAVAAIIARMLVSTGEVQNFLVTYPGEIPLPESAPVGFPAWLGWQHFLNAFFIGLIIRSGWLVRTTQRPPASWTRNNTGLIKTKGSPNRFSLDLWFHLSMDAFWVLNGVVFIVLLFSTGQWTRIVPTSWEIVPNALSAALQYASLQWPTENGWVNYNSLQVLAYFLTVFLAAPLAAVTGIRMSGAWPLRAKRLTRIYPIEVARAIHFLVMLYFVVFITVHVTLVLATGALRNLNHMYGGQDAVNWWGFTIFVLSLLVTAAGVLAARPLVLAPIAGLMGKVGR